MTEFELSMLIGYGFIFLCLVLLTRAYNKEVDERMEYEMKYDDLLFKAYFLEEANNILKDKITELQNDNT